MLAPLNFLLSVQLTIIEEHPSPRLPTLLREFLMLLIRYWRIPFANPSKFSFIGPYRFFLRSISHIFYRSSIDRTAKFRCSWCGIGRFTISTSLNFLLLVPDGSFQNSRLWAIETKAPVKRFVYFAVYRPLTLSRADMVLPYLRGISNHVRYSFDDGFAGF